MFLTRFSAPNTLGWILPTFSVWVLPSSPSVSAVKILLTHTYLYISNSCNSGPRCSSLKATLRLLNRDEVEIDMPSSADSSDEALCRYYADTMQILCRVTMQILCSNAEHCIAVHLFSHCDLFGFPGEQTSNSRGS